MSLVIPLAPAGTVHKGVHLAVVDGVILRIEFHQLQGVCHLSKDWGRVLPRCREDSKTAMMSTNTATSLIPLITLAIPKTLSCITLAVRNSVIRKRRITQPNEKVNCPLKTGFRPPGFRVAREWRIPVDTERHKHYISDQTSLNMQTIQAIPA